MNTIALIGRMTRQPLLRATPGGVAVLNFTLAVDRLRGGMRSTDFIDCIAWRQTAEFIARYFCKGMRMGVCGSLHTHQYVDKQGADRRVVEVIVERVSFCESRGARQREAPSAAWPEQAQPEFAPHPLEGQGLGARPQEDGAWDFEPPAFSPSTAWPPPQTRRDPGAKPSARDPIGRQPERAQPEFALHPLEGQGRGARPQDFAPQDFAPQDFAPQDFAPQDFAPLPQTRQGPGLDDRAKGRGLGRDAKD